MNQTDKDELKAKHEKKKKILKIVGPCLLAVGVIFAIVGFVDFFKAFGSSSMEGPKMFWCLFIGFPMIAVGLMLTVIGYNREMTRYMKNEQVPVVNEMGEEITPAVKAMANAVKNSGTKPRCPYCGAETENDSKFCPHCGEQLIKTCPYCGTTVGKNSHFCDKCGKKL